MRLVGPTPTLIALLFLAVGVGGVHAYSLPERWNSGAAGTSNSYGESRRVADFNGDGRPEIAELLPAGSRITLNIFNVAGERLYSSPPLSRTGFTVKVLDVDQNGTLDYVIQGPTIVGGSANHAVFGFTSGFGLLDSLETPTNDMTDWFHAQLEPDSPLELVVVAFNVGGGPGVIRLHSFGVPGYTATFTPGGLSGSSAPVAEAHDLNANGISELYVSYAGRLFMYSSDQAVAGIAGSGADPEALSLASPWPNPTRGDATLSFRLPSDAEASVRVHDAAGRRVRNIALPRLPAGEHEIRWDGRDDARVPVAPGVYWMELQVAGKSESRKVVRLR